MSEQDINQAKEAIIKVLEALNVTHVVTIDDANDQSISVEEVIAAANIIERTLLLSELPELGDNVPDDLDILAHKIRDIWSRLDPPVQAERGQKIIVIARQQDTNETDDDVADVSILKHLIPEDKLISLSPYEWEIQKDFLLVESQEHCMLFLFDQNFSNDGANGEEGIRIIANLIAMNDAQKLLCGLLTHTVTPDTQQQQWSYLSERHNIPKERFVVIPKLHLSKSPIMFAQLLKFTALSPVFEQLKQETKEIIKKSATAAALKVDEVSIFDLDHIVFKVSADEGLWEPDMLFRLHSMFHRLESRQLAHETGTLETIAAQLRKVNGIPMELLPTPSSAWALQQKELYEFDEHINKNHLPIELGDIFERVDGASTKKYLLLAQPCDLMVRSDGERHPELKRIPLIEIVLLVDKEPNNPTEMPYFDSSPEKKWFVKFKAVHFVLELLLDLCVFNQDGMAKITIGGEIPLGIRPAWKKRYDLLTRYWRRKVTKADMFAPADKETQAVVQVKKKVAKELNCLLFDDDLFKGQLSESEGMRLVTFNCKRIARLTSARAIGMLMEYTSTLGRPAYDRDFGKD
jgi:hypothetical protein